MKGLSIIIYSSNNASTIGQAIGSAIAAIPASITYFSIVVYDKDSNDGTAGILKKLKRENSHIVEVFEQKELLSVNDIFFDENAEVFIIMDGASLPAQGCFSELILALEKDEKVMLAGGFVRLYNGTISHSGRINEYNIGMELEDPFVRHVYHHLPETLPLAQLPFEPQIISTLCYAIRRSDFVKFYPGDKAIRDVTLSDLCFRIRQENGKVVYRPEAVLTRLNDTAQRGFLFAVDPDDLPRFSQLPDFEQPPSRIVEDIRIARENGLIQHVMDIKANRINARVYLPYPNCPPDHDLIILAEFDVRVKTYLLLKYMTKSDPTYSDKKSYKTVLHPGKQFRIFSFPSSHLSGDLCFEFPDTDAAVSFQNIQLFSYPVKNRKQSLVSVVIPCYNHGEFLEEALESLQGISSEKYELIIVNDGSNDPNTLEKLKELEKRGYFVFHQENKGLGMARNEGIMLAKGNYILPLDSDNRLRSIYIDRGIELLDMHPEVGVVYGDVQRFGDSDELILVPEFDPALQIVQNTIDACALFRKQVWEDVEGYETGMVGYQDWAFWLAIAATGSWSFFHIDDVVFDYRIRKGSMVSNTKRYHNPMRDYMLSRNISFVRNEFQKLYYDKMKGSSSITKTARHDHDTVLGSLRIHWNYFIKNLFNRNKDS